MTAMTLVAALASFIFLPLSQALIDAHGWRHALVVLAVILGAITIPLHGVVLRSPDRLRRARRAQGARSASHALRSATFWRLSSAYFLGSMTGIAMTVLAIPFLLQRGYGPGFAAFAVGLVGVSQIPGRLLFAPLAGRLPTAQATASVFALIAVGIGVFVSIDAGPGAAAGLVLLGMGNGMATLSRATSIADLYGSASYGTIAGVTASMTTAARAVGPFAAAVWAAAVGYEAMLWTLVALTGAAALLALRSGSE